MRIDKQKLHDEWRNLYDSTRNKISEGAAQISKIITTAHKDQWRRNTTKTQHKKAK